MRYLILLFFTSTGYISLNAQSFITEHVMSVDSNFEPDKDYTVNDIAWLSGYWVGEGLGGNVEELWSKPQNGKMLCAFRFLLKLLKLNLPEFFNTFSKLQILNI